MRKTRGGWGETFFPPPPPLSQVARVLFSLCSFNTFPPYYLRASESLAQANGIQDPGLWNPEYTQGFRNPTNDWILESSTWLESRIQDYP